LAILLENTLVERIKEPVSAGAGNAFRNVYKPLKPIEESESILERVKWDVYEKKKEENRAKYFHKYKRKIDEPFSMGNVLEKRKINLGEAVKKAVKMDNELTVVKHPKSVNIKVGIVEININL
jgi:predicted nucleotide-binding protein (sugar kinase/HSP70/actin superfamily)